MNDHRVQNNSSSSMTTVSHHLPNNVTVCQSLNFRSFMSFKEGDNDDNDNDNDTLREVPHLSDEGLALQARASGPWPHEKKICLTGKTCSVGKVQNQSVMDRVNCTVVNSKFKEERTRTCTGCCCAEFSINSRNHSDSEQNPQANTHTGNQAPGEARRNQEPGRNPKKAESPRAAIVPAAYPKFCSFVQNTIFHWISFS